MSTIKKRLFNACRRCLSIFFCFCCCCQLLRFFLFYGPHNKSSFYLFNTLFVSSPKRAPQNLWNSHIYTYQFSSLQFGLKVKQTNDRMNERTNERIVRKKTNNSLMRKRTKLFTFQELQLHNFFFNFSSSKNVNKIFAELSPIGFAFEDCFSFFFFCVYFDFIFCLCKKKRKN